MPEMFCPQCGRELELDSGEIRYCRYCGFSLTDTKEALHGYSEQKRLGFSIVTWSYALLLIVTLLLHGEYVSLDTRWVYWLMTILIVASVSFFASAAISALKPAMFTKGKMRESETIGPSRDRAGVLESAKVNPTAETSPARNAVRVLSNRDQRETVREARSIVEGTTRKLEDR
ncbi:MAG TPA: zinc ribbon domain-containing protein [Pyrinomonadaceae bacterium]|nr:zinc ribbon domain-containing protein [Pyrinomonadaceae bacterium]